MVKIDFRTFLIVFTYMRSIPLILLLFLSLFDQLHSQLIQKELAVVNYNVDNGLPDNAVHDIYCDDEGYIWLATEYGVVKYNGHSFQYFNQSHGLEDNEILRFNITENDEIWLANSNGLPTYIKDDKVHDPLDKASKSHLKSINEFSLSNFRDYNGNIWISNKRGIIQIDKNGNIRENNLGPISYLFNYENNILGIVGEMGLVQFNPLTLKHEVIANFVHYGYSKPVIEGSKVYAMVINRGQDKKIQLLSIDLNSHEIKELPVPELTDEKKLGVHAVRIINDKAYICTSAGLFIIKDGKITDHLFKSAKVTSASIDKENGVWVATEKKGIFYIPHQSAELLHLKKINQASIDVIGLGKDQIIVGNKNELVQSRNDSWENLEFSRLNSRINYINKQPRYTFLHTDESLSILDFKTNTSIQYPIGGSNWSLLEEDTLYLSMYNCLVKLPFDKLPELADHINEDDGGGQKYLSDRKILGGKAMQIEQLANNVKVFLTKNGVYLYENNEVIPWSKKYLVNDENISNITTDGDSLLWVSMEKKGVLKFNTNSQKISVELGYDELLNNNIKSLHYNKEHELLCVGTRSGAYIINDAAQIKLTRKNGLPSSNVNNVITFRDFIYAVTSKGLYRISIDEVKDMDFEPNLKITSIKVNNRFVESDEIVTNHLENNLLIKTDVTSFKNDINFLFRIKGGEWENSSDGNIPLRSLSKGKYLLEIKAVTDEGLESNLQTLKIEVLPPLWERWWFRCLAAVTVLALFYLFFKFKVLAYNRDVVKEILLLIAAKLKSKKYFELKNALDGTKTLILLEQILRIEGAKDYVKVHLPDRTLLTKMPMKKILVELNNLERQNAFLQVHKSHIVRIDKIKGYHYQFVLIDEDQIPIGRSYKSAVKEALSLPQKRQNNYLLNGLGLKF